MISSRLLVGIAVGSGHEGVDASLVQVEGEGLSIQTQVRRAMRLPFPLELREAIVNKRQPPPYRGVGDCLAGAVRRVANSCGIDCRDLFCAGLLLPNSGAFSTAAEAIADQAGVTVLTAFSTRDLAAGGVGTPLTPLPDFLSMKSLTEDRLLIHLGSVTSLVLLPANSRTGNIVAGEAGPGGRFLDALVERGTRGKDHYDTGGTRAVQGQPIPELLTAWSRHPFLIRKPPKVLSRSEFDDDFVTHAIEQAHTLGYHLNDLLCTATHFVARCVGATVRQWFPAGDHPRSIFASGGGTRNGFLWQLLQQQFPGETLHRSDDLGVPTLARKAVAAALLCGLTLDGITSNLPQLTGATGGRLLGRIIPGDPRNWATVTGWTAERMRDSIQISRAA
ncbi:anhydro-N-acetylmuramic acid kinase [soil metagenome]